MGHTGGRGGALVNVQITIIGGVELRTGDRHTSLGTPKARLIFAVLAWDAGGTVETGTLINRVWGESLDRVTPDRLYPYINRIRNELKDLGEDAPALTRPTRGHYRLEIDPEAVDARRYVVLTQRARELTDCGNLDEALRVLAEASLLWRGEPLSGLSGPWADHIRNQLTEAYRWAVGLRSNIALRLGRYAEVIPDLTPLVERYPDDESLAQLLAVALYGQGRVADASRVVQRARRLAITELGSDPGAQLRRIEQAIIEEAPAAGLVPSLGYGEIERRNAQVPDTLHNDVDLVGREREMRLLIDAVTGRSGTRSQAVALEAIDGMPGIGKTSLAVHVAHQMKAHFPDGRILLELRAHATQPALTPEEALTELLCQLDGTTPNELPRGVERLTALWRTTMSTRRALVILDDAAGPEQVRPLLPGASPGLLIVTSRHSLAGLPGVRPISLDIMPEGEAVALFLNRVGADREASATALKEIVRLCGYLPLAIQIATSRLLTRPSWSAADLAERLRRGRGRLNEIRSGPVELVTAFQLSYRELTPAQRRLFRRLSLHPGPEFGVHAAAALAGISVGEAERALEDLLHVHLVMEPSSHRYRLHDLLCEYARDLVGAEEDTDEPDRADERLTLYYLYTADQADRRLYPHRRRIDIDPPSQHTASLNCLDAIEPQQWFINEAANLLILLEHTRRHGSPRTNALLTHVLAGFLDTAGHLASALPHLRRAVAHWQASGDQPAEARALLDLSTVCGRLGAYQEAFTAASSALEIAQPLGDHLTEVEVIHQQGIVQWYAGLHRQALPHLRQALGLRMRHSDRQQQARSKNLLGIALLHLGEHQEARVLFTEALSMFREVGYRRGQVRALNNLGELFLETGQVAEAERAYLEAMDLIVQTGSNGDYATVQMNLARAKRMSGALDQSLALYREALPALRRAGDRRHESIALNGLGLTLQAAGRQEESLAHHAAALSVARSIAAQTEEAQALRSLGQAEVSTGRYAQAEEHLQASLTLARRLGSPTEEAEALRALAAARRHSGRPGEAARLHQQF